MTEKFLVNLRMNQTKLSYFITKGKTMKRKLTDTWGHVGSYQKVEHTCNWMSKVDWRENRSGIFFEEIKSKNFSNLVKTSAYRPKKLNENRAGLIQI